jgi:cytochrome c peroxidase
MKQTIYLLALALLLAACRKNEWVVQETPNDTADIQALETTLNIWLEKLPSYEMVLPKYLVTLGMQTRPVNQYKATLGRVLFYDKNLSRDRTISCASCHKQSNAFSDHTAFSKGTGNNTTHRNSPPLANVANFYAHYNLAGSRNPLLFWDGRAVDVEEQSRQTFANPVEMGIEMSEVVERIKELPYYAYLWKQTYSDSEITEKRVLESLAEFVETMSSCNSKLDKAMENANGDLNSSGNDTIITNVYYASTVILPVLNLNEDRGRVLFVTNCSKCHSPIRPFQAVMEACNGLDESYTDQGLGALTGNPADHGVFKSPSLRNIALTAPYMHDGRFKTLEEAVEFYSTGVKNHPNLHSEMKKNGEPNFHFTEQEKKDLVAFLKTFTDDSFILGERFSNPFK